VAACPQDLDLVKGGERLGERRGSALPAQRRDRVKQVVEM